MSRFRLCRDCGKLGFPGDTYDSEYCNKADRWWCQLFSDWDWDYDYVHFWYVEPSKDGCTFGMGKDGARG